MIIIFSLTKTSGLSFALADYETLMRLSRESTSC